MKAGEEAVKAINKLEKPDDTLLKGCYVKLLPSQKGRSGYGSDVRDVVLVSATGVDIFGISCKVNNNAFKHPRLSPTSDFVKLWGISDQGASKNFINVRDEVFKDLKNYSNVFEKFTDIPNLHSNIFGPLLTGFASELLYQNSINPSRTAKALFNYVIGAHDFYKIVHNTKRSEVLLYKYNMNKTLAGSGGPANPCKISYIDSPTASESSRSVYLDNFFTFNFRLHSASEFIENSLKFDITAPGIPHKGVSPFIITY